MRRNLCPFRLKAEWRILCVTIKEIKDKFLFEISLRRGDDKCDYSFFAGKHSAPLFSLKRKYWAQCHILLCDGAWDPVSDDTVTSRKKDKLLFFLL